MLRDTMLDGRVVREGDRVMATQEEADFLLPRGYARAEPVKPRRSKKGKPGHVDKKQAALDKLLAAASVAPASAGSGSALDAGGETARGESEASGLEEASASASASTEAGEAEILPGLLQAAPCQQGIDPVASCG